VVLEGLLKRGGRTIRSVQHNEADDKGQQHVQSMKERRYYNVIMLSPLLNSSLSPKKTLTVVRQCYTLLLSKMHSPFTFRDCCIEYGILPENS
jgi:hypothetical protein